MCEREALSKDMPKNAPVIVKFIILKEQRLSCLFSLQNPQSYQLQVNRLQELRTSLSNYNIKLTINFSSTLHDREIRFAIDIYCCKICQLVSCEGNIAPLLKL